MLVVHVVERVHGAASEKELGGDGQETDFPMGYEARGRGCGRPKWGLRPAEERKKPGDRPAEEPMNDRGM